MENRPFFGVTMEQVVTNQDPQPRELVIDESIGEVKCSKCDGTGVDKKAQEQYSSHGISGYFYCPRCRGSGKTDWVSNVTGSNDIEDWWSGNTGYSGSSGVSGWSGISGTSGVQGYSGVSISPASFVGSGGGPGGSFISGGNFSSAYISHSGYSSISPSLPTLPKVPIQKKESIIKQILEELFSIIFGVRIEEIRT